MVCMNGGAAMPSLKLQEQGLPRKALGHVMPRKSANSHVNMAVLRAGRGQPGPNEGCPGVLWGQWGWQGMLAAGRWLGSWSRLCRWYGASKTSLGLWLRARRVLWRTPVGHLGYTKPCPKTAFCLWPVLTFMESGNDTQLNYICWLNYLEKNL